VCESDDEAKADINYKDSQQKSALLHAVDRNYTACMMVLPDHGGDGHPAHVSDDAKAPALLSILERDEFRAHDQAATFMLLVHGTDIDATWNVSSKSALSAASIYEHIYLERWYGIASNILSEDVEVDTRVGRGDNGLYHEPPEWVLQYLGLSMAADQVVNNSLDDGTTRAAAQLRPQRQPLARAVPAYEGETWCRMCKPWTQPINVCALPRYCNMIAIHGR
jgi:hypothetical protein